MAENSTPTPKSSEKGDAENKDVVAGGHQMESGPVSYTHLTLPTIYSV